MGKYFGTDGIRGVANTELTPEFTLKLGRILGHHLKSKNTRPKVLIPQEDSSYRVRRRTPRECFKLMGLENDDIDRIQETRISDTRQYKMAGNSIVVDVLEEIFRNLFIEND